MRASKHGKSFRSVGRRTGFVLAMTAMISALFFGSAVAAEDEISVPFQDILVADPGSTTEIANLEVDERLVGETCSVAINADNQGSVHPGNNLVARSGSAEVVMVGIEDEANGKIVESQDIELGDRVVVELVMGPEGISSLGFGVSILCNQDEPDIAPALEESEAPKADVETDPCSDTTGSESLAGSVECCDGDAAGSVECCDGDAAGSVECCDGASAGSVECCDGDAAGSVECCDGDAAGSVECCDEAGAQSGASVSSTCCAESGSTAASSNQTCPEPKVLSELEEAPTAESVTAEPTYTG